MRKLLTVVIAAMFAVVATGSFAASHAGAAKDDKGMAKEAKKDDKGMAKDAKKDDKAAAKKDDKAAAKKEEKK